MMMMMMLLLLLLQTVSQVYIECRVTMTFLHLQSVTYTEHTGPLAGTAAGCHHGNVVSAVC